MDRPTQFIDDFREGLKSSWGLRFAAFGTGVGLGGAAAELVFDLGGRGAIVSAVGLLAISGGSALFEYETLRTVEDEVGTKP